MNLFQASSKTGREMVFNIDEELRQELDSPAYWIKKKPNDSPLLIIKSPFDPNQRSARLQLKAYYLSHIYRSFLSTAGYLTLMLLVSLTEISVENILFSVSKIGPFLMISLLNGLMGTTAIREIHWRSGKKSRSSCGFFLAISMMNCLHLAFLAFFGRPAVSRIAQNLDFGGVGWVVYFGIFLAFLFFLPSMVHVFYFRIYLRAAERVDEDYYFDELARRFQEDREKNSSH